MTELPEKFHGVVDAIGSEVQHEDIDTWQRVRETEDRSHKLRTVLQVWEGQQNEERSLRRSYARTLVWILIAQVALVNLAFFAIGFERIAVEQWVAVTFIMAVFGEIAAMVLVVVKYLFTDVASDVLRLIEKL